MIYLHKTNSIFAVSITVDDNYMKCWFGTTEESVQCGIFNLNDNNWIDIKPLKYTNPWPGNYAFSCSLCYDSNNDNVYIHNKSTPMYSSTLKYDLNKHEWYTICKEGHANDAIMWFDNNSNTIHAFPRNTKGSRAWRHTLDLRTYKKKWIHEEIQFDKMLNDKEQHFTFFT